MTEIEDYEYVCSLTNHIADRLSTYELLTQLAEEAAELAQAALKYRRALRTERVQEDTSPTPKTAQEAKKSLEEEVADVELCIYALEMPTIDFEPMKHKAERWLRRLEAYEDATP